MIEPWLQPCDQARRPRRARGRTSRARPTSSTSNGRGRSPLRVRHASAPPRHSHPTGHIAGHRHSLRGARGRGRARPARSALTERGLARRWVRAAPRPTHIAAWRTICGPPSSGRAASPRKAEASPRARSPRPSSPSGGSSPRKARPASPRGVAGSPSRRDPTKTADGRSILVMGDKPHRIDRRAVIPGATFHVPGKRDEVGITAYGVGGNIFERTA